ncbi:hypothetical protein [Pseudonocardia sp. GCM10023141]|uniref:hypothetical protein n=1 Tax=Pseudonocardia sp. GCM10023141 TaxID=3252653 RepID=UPI0036116FE7
MNPIHKALTDGVDPLRLKVAAHEVGHGIVWRHAGFPIVRMVITTGVFGGIGEAYCQRGRLWLDAGNIDGFLVGLMAGAAAQSRCASRYLGHLFAGSAARGNAAHDVGEFRRLAKAHRSTLTIGAAQNRAVAILGGRSGRLDTLTAELARTGRLSGGAL